MDIMQREGAYPVPPHAPKTLGVEFSGPIVAVGKNVTAGSWKVGDEVIGLAGGVRDTHSKPFIHTASDSFCRERMQSLSRCLRRM